MCKDDNNQSSAEARNVKKKKKKRNVKIPKSPFSNNQGDNWFRQALSNTVKLIT